MIARRSPTAFMQYRAMTVSALNEFGLMRHVGVKRRYRDNNADTFDEDRTSHRQHTSCCLLKSRALKGGGIKLQPP